MLTKTQRKSLTWGKRIIITVLILFAAFYGILSLAERSEEPVRLGLEDYLSQVTGGRAEITTMAAISLVPDTMFKMGGILIRNPNDSEKLLGKVETAYISVPFWHLLFGISDYQGFEVTGLEIATGVLFPKKTVLDYAGISDPTPKQMPPIFLIEGTYNNLPLLITAEMIRKKGKVALYAFSKAFSVTFKLGELEGKGIILREFNGVRMENGILTRKGHKVEFTAEDIHADPMNIRIKGTIDGTEFNGTLTKTGDGNVLEIVPVKTDAKAIANIQNLMNDIEKDLGLPEKRFRLDHQSGAEQEMKRVYTLSSHTKTEDGYVIQLDGKAVKTPSGQPLAAPNKAIADIIVQEWAAQQEMIVPDSMPITQFLTTAIDRMRDRGTITKTLLKFLDTDLLCYRTKEPQEIAKRQKEIWDRWLTWFDEHFESPLEVTYGIDALTQDADTHKQIWNYLEALDEYYFTVLQVVTSQSGSIVLGLAFIEHEATPEDVYNAAELEEMYHSEIAGEAVHGADPVQERRQATLRRELETSKRFLELLDQ